MKDLTVSNIERQNVLNNRFAINKIQEQLVLRIMTAFMSGLDYNEELKNIHIFLYYMLKHMRHNKNDRETIKKQHTPVGDTGETCAAGS